MQLHCRGELSQPLGKKVCYRSIQGRYVVAADLKMENWNCRDGRKMNGNICAEERKKRVEMEWIVPPPARVTVTVTVSHGHGQ